MISAASRGNVLQLARLLENNANIEERDRDGFSPLHCAACFGHEDAVRLLLENNADIAARDKEGTTPLLWAAHNGHEGAARLLLQNNADITARDNDSRSPLHYAAMNGYEGAVRLLLENNADTRRWTRCSAWRWARRSRHSPLVSSTRRQDADSPLHLAAMNGHEGAVRLLLQNNADLEARDNDGFSPLHLAAMNGHEGVVRLLLENNADTAARDNRGHTALDEMLCGGHDAVAALLLAGALRLLQLCTRALLTTVLSSLSAAVVLAAYPRNLQVLPIVSAAVERTQG
ncbi:hypothetical protein AB1Y20_020901 [Prymnesium parvum]|uniref:Uncharacterized protein n=1 Tax=Prymnesium parvum TaxID=97485 RepID=A0AB34JWK1_PRYPA